MHPTVVIAAYRQALEDLLEILRTKIWWVERISNIGFLSDTSQRAAVRISRVWDYHVIYTLVKNGSADFGVICFLKAK
jgi:hypothetical protein